MKHNNDALMNRDELSELVAKSKAGDQAAFAELYDRTSPDLFRCIRAMTRDEDLTWDIQQDSYLLAFRKLDTLENNEAFFPWLRRIAVNVTASKMRQRLPVNFTDLGGEEDEAIPELPDLNEAHQPELALDRQETSRLVREILSTLTEAQQLIVGMRYYDELSVKEIAETLNLSVGTVKAQLFQGRKRVETAVRGLEQQGVKLYGLSPVAFLMALMRRMEPAQAVSQKAVKAAVTKAAADAVAVAAKPVTALTFNQMLKGSVAKILIGALSVAVIGGGIWAGSKLLRSDKPVAPKQPTETLEALLLSNNTAPVSNPDTAEDLTEPIVYVTVPATEPETSTEPTEPTEPTESTEPTKPTEPTESTEPSEPEASDPAGFDAAHEEELDKASLANVETACSAAASAWLAESRDANATYFQLPNASSDSVVIVKDVQILSEQANSWSNDGERQSFVGLDDPGVPGDYMAVFCFHKGVGQLPSGIYAYLEASNDPTAFADTFTAVFGNGFPEWIAVQIERCNDEYSFASLRSAYAEAASAAVTEENDTNTVFEKSADGQTVTVTVRNVEIESTRANNWSDQAADSLVFPVPADPGVPGIYSMVFTWRNNELVRTELADFYDVHAFDAQNADPGELSLEAEDAANLRRAVAMVQAAALMQSADDHGVTRAGEPGAYTYTTTVEALQTVAGWHSSTLTSNGIANLSRADIPAKVKGEFWTSPTTKQPEPSQFDNSTRPHGRHPAVCFLPAREENAK